MKWGYKISSSQPNFLFYKLVITAFCHLIDLGGMYPEGEKNGNLNLKESLAVKGYYGYENIIF